MGSERERARGRERGRKEVRRRGWTKTNHMHASQYYNY